MPRIPVVYRAIDEAGNATGGSPQQVRIYDDFACTVPSVVTDDSAGGTTIAQPLVPNAGTYTTLAVTTAAVDTTITVVSTTGFAVGQLITIYDPTNTVYRFIRAILSGPPRLTLESAVGFIFSTTNTQVGNLDQVGVVGGWVLDTSHHYSQVTDVASGRKGPPQLISAIIGSANVAVLEEGAGGGTRPTINFIGTPVTAVDNPGASRIDVTIQGKFDFGTEALPGVHGAGEEDTGLWWDATNTLSIVAGGKRSAKFLFAAGAVNYPQLNPSATGNPVGLVAGGTDTNIDLTLASKGTGSVNMWTGGGARRAASFLDVAGAVNYFQFQPITTGGSIRMLADGSDTDIGIIISAKGAGDVQVYSGSLTRVLARFLNVASSVNRLDFSPSATGAALKIEAGGSDTAIDINIVPKGTGVLKYKGNPLWPLNSKSAQLSADVTMSTAGTWYDGPTLSLEVGTWLVCTTLTISSGNIAAGRVTARISDGSTHYASTETEVPGAANDPVSLSVVARITLGSTTTIKAQANANQNAGAILAQTPTVSSGNNASTIAAFQVLTS